MPRQLLMGIDVGTSGVKVGAYDLRLRPVASARREIVTHHARPGWVEQDPEALLAGVVEAVGELLRATDGEVVACGLDHQGESVVGWDAGTGDPLTPVIVWQDQRGAEVLGRMTETQLDEVATRSGLPPDAYFSAASLGWLLADGGLRHRPGLRLGTLDAFLSDRLGAGFATDPSTASRTQLSGVVGTGVDGWDDRLLALFGVPAEVLPAIVDSTGDLGELRHPTWRQPLPLRARVVDQQASLAGTGCVVPGRAKATYGTGVFLLLYTGGDRVWDVHGAGLLPTIAWRIEGRSSGALEGGVFSAGSLLEWLAGDLGLAQDVPTLVALAASVPDAGGVRILPALGGLGAPWWRPTARGVIAGLSATTRPGHIAHAALDAIALRVADIVRAADALVRIEDLRIDGGLTRAAGFAERQATMLGRPVWRTDADATARGAAALAAVGAGFLPRIEDIDPLLPAFERVDPGPGAQPLDQDTWIRFAERAAGLLD